MTDSGKESKSKRPPSPAAGDDPWAKWRKPETAPTPAPAPPAAAQEAATPVAPKVRERPTGTLSPVKPATPARVTAKKPYNKPFDRSIAPARS